MEKASMRQTAKHLREPSEWSEKEHKNFIEGAGQEVLSRSRKQIKKRKLTS